MFSILYIYIYIFCGGESVLESALRLVGERSEVVGKERIRGGKQQKKKGRGRDQKRWDRNA